MRLITNKNSAPRSRRPLALILAVGAALVGMGLASAPTASATVTDVKLSQADAEGQLAAVGIGWWSRLNCSDRLTQGCTSLEQVNQATVSGLITFKSASGCGDVEITGGTEVGHADGTYSHWNGYKLDIPDTACVTNFITNAYTYTGNRSDGAYLYQAPSGNIYAHEYWLNHFDITYYTCGC